MAENHYLYGLHSVTTALEQDASVILELWYDASRKDKRMTALLDLAQKAGIRIHKADKHTLKDKAGNDKHQGIVARCRLPSARTEADLEVLLGGLKEAAFLLVLDGVQDPHNLGACLRSAEAAGVQAVIAPKDRAVSLTPTVLKVSSGAAQTVPFIQVTNLSRTLKALKQAGIWLVGLDGYAELSLYETDLSGPLALVMGAEGQGLRRLSKEQCDFLVRIPMRGRVESLNVSVATGVCLFEALRQRGG